MRLINIIYIVATICLILVAVLFYDAMYAQKKTVAIVPIFEKKAKEAPIKEIVEEEPREEKIDILERELEGVEPLKLDPLNLELTATLVDDVSEPYAVIRDKETGRQGAFMVGDIIKGALVFSIMLSKVILDRSGIREVLTMTSRSTDGAVELSDIIEIYDNRNVVHTRALVSKYKNLNNILKEVTLVPAISSGRLKGIRIRNIKDNSIFKRAKLENGDIIKKINNYNLNNVGDAIRAYSGIIRQLKVNPVFNIELTVERGGKDKTINYEIVD